jgi:hypothetical protein
LAAERYLVRAVGGGASLLAALSSTTLAQQPPLPPAAAITAADSAATAWLAVLAAQGYVASWEMASPPFQKRIRREDWATNADRFREQFLRAGLRRLIESHYRLAVPPQDPGEYVTLRYLTVVTPERQVSETLLLIRDLEGTFRVADYVLWPNVEGEPLLYYPPSVGVRPPPRPSGPPLPPPTTNQAAPRR